MNLYVYLIFTSQGRAQSRAKSRRNLDYTEVLNALQEKGMYVLIKIEDSVLPLTTQVKVEHGYYSIGVLTRV